MKSVARLFAIATAVALFLAVTPSWGEPSGPTDSDAPRHIAGTTGCGALALNLDTDAGLPTTIDNAPGSNSIEHCRPAVVSGALLLNRNNVFPGRADELWLLERRIVDADLRDTGILPRLMQRRERLKKIDGRP